jgi:hypothetical protein
MEKQPPKPSKPLSKKDRFKNVAGRRVQKVLDDIDNLSKCSNKNVYDFSEQDVRKMMKAINEKVSMLKLSFEANNKARKQTFEF